MNAPFLRRLPIRRKLILIGMVTSGCALVLTCAAFIAFEQHTFRRDMGRVVGITAQIIAYNSASSLAFRDGDSATLTLAALEAQPGVLRACIYEADGEVFATYRREDVAADTWPAPLGEDALSFGPTLECFHVIHHAGERRGMLYLQVDLSEYHKRWWRYLAIAGGVFLAALFVTWLIVRRLQEMISDPIGRLAHLAERVGGEQNYSLRAERAGDDEIGRLVEGFNHMLEQIQARDAELHAAHRELELRVEARTRSLEQAGLELVREKERFQFIFDHIPVGVSLYSLRGKKTFAQSINSAHLRICGLTLDDLADAKVFERISHPEDYAEQGLLQERLARGEIDHFSMEKRYLRPDGEVVWVVFSTQRKAYPDGRVEALSTVVDITKLKRAQEEAACEHARFKFIFDSVPVGIAWMMYGGSETRIVNPALARITGVPAELAHDIRRYTEATHPDDRAAQSTLAAKMARGEIDQYTVEKRYRRPDGDWNHAELTVRLLPLPGTKQTQELATIVDITARKRAEAELQVIHHQLLETSRQAGMAEVATGVLHNVGNVLNSVNVSATVVADLVRRSKAPNIAKLHELLIRHRDDLGRFFVEDPKGKLIPDYLATLAEAVAIEQTTMLSELDGLQQNIGHIKDIVSMQQSYAKTSGVVESLPACDLLEDAVRMNAASLMRHEVEVVRDYEANPRITVEKNKVLQILVNFVRNAKFACDEGERTEKRITLRVRVEEGGVALSVGDNGVGIPPENLTRIFAHGFTTRKNGHGFGLHSGALSARELGGSVTAESEGPGCGATFTLRLPFKPEGDPS